MNTFSIKNKIFLVLTLVLTFFWLPGFAKAYFADEAEAISNTFHIGTLEVVVDEESQSVGVSDSSNESFDFDVSNTGSVSAQYKLSATPTACTSDFFSGINVEVDQGGTLYSGSLSGLTASTTNEGLWDIEVTNDSIDAPDGETCEVELLLQSWQEEFTNWNTGGFSEEITIELTITANEDMGAYAVPDVVLNEIMPNPDGSDYQDGLDGEWVELYNNTGQTIDLDGWYVEDLVGNQIEIGGTSDSLDTTENGTTTIESFGWLVVYMNVRVLNNSGTETVYLYDNNGILQDEYAYTAGNDTGEDPEDGATPNDENGDAATGTSASATEGKTDARIPDGIGEWVDPDPTAGGPNYVTREELEELGYAEGKIDFLLNRQEIARQNREARENQEDLIKTKVNEADPVKTEVNGASDPVKSDESKESSDNGASEKDEDKKEEEIDEPARNEDEKVDEDEKTNKDEEKQKVNEDEDSDKSEQERDEEEFGDDDKKEKDEDKGQGDNKKVDEDLIKDKASSKALSNEASTDDIDEKETEKEDFVKDEDSKETSSDEIEPIKTKVNGASDPVKDKDSDESLSNKADPVKNDDSTESPVNGVGLVKTKVNEAGDNTN